MKKRTLVWILLGAALFCPMIQQKVVSQASSETEVRAEAAPGGIPLAGGTEKQRIFTTILEDMNTVPLAASEETELAVQRKVELLMEECLKSGTETEYEKALWFHDWIIYNANYDYSETEFYADGVLLKGKGVCQSYTLAYKALLDRAGIENIAVSAPEMNHAWNIVKINGTWTHVDCTWDDPNEGGYENRQYFGLGDAEMEQDHTWDRSQYPKCFKIQREVSAEKLPEAYPLMSPLDGIDFVFADTLGNTLTRKNVGGESVLLVYGRETCGNTKAFVNELTAWESVLAKHGVKVLIVLESEEEARRYEQNVPFSCVVEKDTTYERGGFLGRMGLEGYYTYPLVVLQNRQGTAFYYSTGYVSEPEKVIATTLKKLPVTEDISASDTGNENPTPGGNGGTTDTGNENPTPEGNGGSTGTGNENPTPENGGSVSGTGEHKHNWIVKVDQEAACAAAGSRHKECTVCGAKGETETIPATGKHRYGSFQVTKEATVFAAGTKTRTCSVCKAKDTETIKKLKATIKVNIKTLPLTVRQSTTAVKVTCGKGDKIVSWESSNKKVATVTSRGKITGKKAGRATITVKLKSGKRAKITVKVQKKAVTTKKLTLNKKSLVLKKGKKYQLKATVTPITSREKVRFTSTNKKILTVTGKGKITAKKKGTAYVKVTSGKKTVKCKVKVK